MSFTCFVQLSIAGGLDTNFLRREEKWRIYIHGLACQAVSYNNDDAICDDV